MCGRVSERGGCFQCFDPFLLNLERGELVPQNWSQLIGNRQTAEADELAP